MWAADTASSVFLFLWWQYSFFSPVTEHLCDCFQCPSHLGSLIPSHRVELVCAVFVCVETIARELKISTSNLVIQSLKKPEVLNSCLALKSLKQNYKVLDA